MSKVFKKIIAHTILTKYKWRFIIFVFPLVSLSGNAVFTNLEGGIIVPKRIVSLAPSHTEILYSLGLVERIVGVSDYSDYPEEAKKKPRVGGYHAPNIERIVSVNPDMVIASGLTPPHIIKKIRDLNINIYVFEPKRVSDIIDTIIEIGKLTGKEKEAKKVTGEMKRRLDELKREIRKINNKRNTKVYWEIWENPIITVGGDTFANDLIKVAGGKNIFEDSKIDYPKVGLESMISRNPDVIIVTSRYMGKNEKVNIEHIKKRKGWENISAIKKGRIYLIDPDLVNRPGPRIVDGLYEVAKAIHKL